MEGPRTPWSRRRRRLLAALGTGAVVLGPAGLVLPARVGIPMAFLGALCALLLVAALVVFVAVPGPGTPGTLLRTSPLAGAVLVVAVLLALSDPGGSLRRVWGAAAVLAAGWTAFAVWETRRSGG